MDAPILERLSLQLGWWLAFGVPLAFVLRWFARRLVRGELQLRRAYEFALVVQVVFAVSISLGFHANEACETVAFWLGVRWTGVGDALQSLSGLRMLTPMFCVWVGYLLVEAWLRRRSDLGVVHDDAVKFASIGMVGTLTGLPLSIAIDLALGSQTLAPQGIGFLLT